MTFRTHAGERLAAACKQVADDWRELARAIRKENAYAAHVTEDEKESAMLKMLARADEIEGGMVNSFTIWQRVNVVLTGECIAFLGK